MPHMQQRVLLLLGTGIAVMCCINVLSFIHLINLHPLQDDLSLGRAASSTDFLHGREPLLMLLETAGIENISLSELKSLPSWEHVIMLYGDKPKIVGLETCDKFRNSTDAKKGLLAPAGPFNSGTNLLGELLWQNCELPDIDKKYDTSGLRWQSNWGKHQPPRVRLQHYVHNQIDDNSQIMPVVAVRDPYSWMQSMCRRRYAATWYFTKEHCPNLIVNHVDDALLERAREEFDDDVYLDMIKKINDTRVIPVQVEYKKITTNHLSLAHMWNDWYDEYLQADFPRVMVRMEDLVFFGKEVAEQVCTCVGGEMWGDKFIYVTDSAKEGEIKKGQFETNLLQAMIRYGSVSRETRTNGMTVEDQEYARQVLRPDIMKLFGYSHPS